MGAFALLAGLVCAVQPLLRENVAEVVLVGGMELRTGRLPPGLVLRDELGIITTRYVNGQIIHHAAAGAMVLETRAIITPGGDYLLMFPEGGHYGSSRGKKVNDMIAYRSSDKGRTWRGPSLAFDIDYNQHGFVPLIPRGSTRIYAFGTQPIPGKWSWEHGHPENAPIGFRWSDDDGRNVVAGSADRADERSGISEGCRSCGCARRMPAPG